MIFHNISHHNISCLAEKQKLIQTDNLLCEANYITIHIAYLLDSSSACTSPAFGL